MQAALLRAYPYVDRVESKSNIADGPSRGDFVDMIRIGARQCTANLDALATDSASSPASEWWGARECERLAKSALG